jgi:putative RecB family exonuclease
MAMFSRCPLQFRFRVIDELPEPPSEAAIRGRYVHRVLEIFLGNNEPASRTREKLLEVGREVFGELGEDEDFVALELTQDQTKAFIAKSVELLERYLECEDPTRVRPVAVERQMEIPMGKVLLRGRVDRVDESEDGGYVIVDYKTGRMPGPGDSGEVLNQVITYALLARHALDGVPHRVRVLFLPDRTSLEREVSERTLEYGMERCLQMLGAIERACDNDDFRPRPSAMCASCPFVAFCPAHGGDPSKAVGTSRMPSGGGTSG